MVRDDSLIQHVTWRYGLPLAAMFCAVVAPNILTMPFVLRLFTGLLVGIGVAAVVDRGSLVARGSVAIFVFIGAIFVVLAGPLP